MKECRVLPIQLGKYTLSNNVFLAPMAGVTDLPFRKLCRKLGTGMVTGEMTSCIAALRSTEKSRLRGVHIGEPEPRSIQIVGWSPEMMADAARYNVDQGASIIDINMGCPARKVCNRLAGSALLGDETQVANILESVVGAVDVPVTLKIRTGTDPANRNGVSIARIAENCGIQLLAVHGRTRHDKYLGSAEYETVRQIKSAVEIPVVANGDITSVAKAREVLSYTGADGIMIGRAAHGAPWLPGQIAASLEAGRIVPGPDPESRKLIIIEHLRELYRFYGSYKGVRIARKHIKWYVQSIPGNQQFRSLVNRVENPGAQSAMVFDFISGIQDQLKAA